MPDTYTTSLRFQLQTTGGNSSTWGTIADTQYQLIEAAITGDNGYAGGGGGINIGDANYSLTVANGTADQSRQALYPFVGALTADRNVTIPAVVKIGRAANFTTGGHNIILKVGGGSTLTVPPDGSWYFFYCDGVNVTGPVGRYRALGGTTTNDNAASGQIGEYLENSSSGAFVSGALANCVSLSLTSGDWDVWGSVQLVPAGGAGSILSVVFAITTVSGTPLAWPAGGAYTELQNVALTGTNICPVGTARLSLASTTTIYIAGFTFYTQAGMTVGGFIGARRRR